jgi:leucyl aminopeptidase
MQITFRPTADSSTPRLLARIVDQDSLPADLSRSDAEGAAAARFSGKTGQVFESFAERDGGVVRQVLVGAGKADADDRGAALEKAGAALAARYLTSGESGIALDLSGSSLSAADVAEVLLGLRLRAWRHDAYRTRLKDEQKRTLAEVAVIGAPDGAEAAWQTEQKLAEGVELTRNLVAEPANVIYPESFVERVTKAFEGTGAEIVVLDEDAMRQLGMGALLGVSQGSAKPARLLAIKWLGGAKAGKPTAFVGKGVTFDTGGISLKQPAGMEDMKWDMGGAGAVAGAMLSIVKRKAKANVIGVCGLVENMPGGNAMRPGDIVTTMSGQTVEVINTDAEGRLILGDGLWYAQQLGATHLVDVATLTGACVVALGRIASGLFGQPDGWVQVVQQVSRRAGDRCWPMPLFDEYADQLRSEIADMTNTGGRPAGACTAAMFLKEFAGGLPWAHLDVAGTAWTDEAKPWLAKGPTGVAVRTLAELAFSSERWK